MFSYPSSEKTKKLFFIFLVLLLAFLFFFFGFNSKKESSKNLVSENPSNFFYQILEEGITSGDVSAGTKVMKNRDELAEFWKNINFSRPSVALPEINFDVNYAVAVVSEVKPTGGFYLHLEKVEDLEDKILVSLKESSPGSGCFTTEIITQPFSLFIISKTDKKITFQTEPDIKDCR
ncbi:MAG: protease complex subunit PrcB family protein [Candidatus Paceibacterota bacterium]